MLCLVLGGVFLPGPRTDEANAYVLHGCGWAAYQYNDGLGVYIDKPAQTAGHRASVRASIGYWNTKLSRFTSWPA